MSLKKRLLEVLEGTTLSDFSEGALVEVLIDRLKEAKQDLTNARNAIFKEGLRADEIQRSAHEEIRQLRTNPLAAAHGDFYFAGPDANSTFVVSIGGYRNISAYQRTDRIDYAMHQLTSDEFARRQK